MYFKKRVLFFLYFYRILGREKRFSFLRIMGYLFLGYVMSRNFDVALLVPNTLVLVGILMFAFSLNDFWDFKASKEENTIGVEIKKGTLSEKRALLYIISPLALTGILIYLLIFVYHFPLVNPFYWVLGSMLLLVSYSAPPLRLKEKPLLSYIAASTAVVVLFFQGYSLTGSMNFEIGLFGALLFLFQAYMHNLHVLGDFYKGDSVKHVTKEFALKLLPIIPVISFAFSALFILINPVFGITTVFSLIRIWSWRKGTTNININKIRKNLFGSHVLVYELLLYGLAGILHLI